MLATIYSKPGCKYCTLAKTLLSEKGIAFVEKDIMADLTARREWQQLVQEKEHTVPQIVYDGRHVGGYDGLKAHLSK